MPNRRIRDKAVLLERVRAVQRSPRRRPYVSGHPHTVISARGMTEIEARRVLRLLAEDSRDADLALIEMYRDYVEPHAAPVPDAERVRQRLEQCAEGVLQQAHRWPAAV